MSNRPLEPYFEWDKTTLLHVDQEWQAVQDITQIAPHIYLGSFDNSVSKATLERHNIRYVMQLDQNRKATAAMQLYTQMGIRHMQIVLSDELTSDMRPHMDAMYNYVKKAVGEKRNILVHDSDGVNASAAAVAFYIVRSLYERQQKPDQPILSKLVDTMMGKRKCISIRQNYLSQISQAELYLRGNLGQQKPWS